MPTPADVPLQAPQELGVVVGGHWAPSGGAVEGGALGGRPDGGLHDPALVLGGLDPGGDDPGDRADHRGRDNEEDPQELRHTCRQGLLGAAGAVQEGVDRQGDDEDEEERAHGRSVAEWLPVWAQ